MPLCPRCRTPLPEPPEAFCPHCGAPTEAGSESPAPPRASDLDPDDGSAPAPEFAPGDRPAEALPPLPPPAATEAPPAPEPPGIPWDDRGRLGFATALVDTTVQVLRAPTDFYRRMRPSGGVGGALVYAVVLGYLGFLAKTLYEGIFQAVMGNPAPDLKLGPEFDRAFAMMQGGGGVVLQLVVAPFTLAAAAFVVAALDHLALLLLGGARGGFEATFRVLAFANAANVAALVPLCGAPAGAVWSLVLSIIGLSVVHCVSWQKATAAVLLPLVVACCCCGGAIGLLAALAAGALR